MAGLVVVAAVVVDEVVVVAPVVVAFVEVDDAFATESVTLDPLAACASGLRRLVDDRSR